MYNDTDKSRWLSNPGSVLVVGFARSGAGAAELLVRHGFSVTVTDRSERPMDSEVIERLESSGVHFVFGGHPDSLLEQTWQFVVKNPGIPYHVPFIQRLQACNIPVVTEVEVASWFTSSPFYAITGSNGKTTTTTLVGEMLRQDEKNPAVAGNIGTVLSGVVETVSEEQPIVLEVSSFQLMGIETFCPQIACLLNFYPAHLDYHGTFEAYQDAKWRLFKNQTSTQTAVLNWDQDVMRTGAQRLKSSILWFSTGKPDFEQGVGIEDDDIVMVQDGQVTPVIKVSEVGLKGAHNLQNVLAAIAIARAADVSLDVIQAVTRSFQGVEHRLEYVKTVNGVAYYNDSKATNSDACKQALRAFPERLVWIAGGLDRGVSFMDLVPELTGRVKTAILLGETQEKLRETCLAAGVERILAAGQIEDAVRIAHDIAAVGDTVLLSPACASWDMFKSFEERGSMFKEAVHRL